MLPPECSAARRAAAVDDRLLLICALATAAGLIHVLAAIEHVQEYALYAVFFALLAPAQVGWAIAVYRTRAPRLLVLGAVGCLAIVALWIFSRTTGLPIGPDPWHPEATGTLDVTASLNELVLVWLIACRLRPPASRAIRRLDRGVVSLAVVLLLTSSLVLVGPGHQH